MYMKYSTTIKLYDYTRAIVKYVGETRPWVLMNTRRNGRGRR